MLDCADAAGRRTVAVEQRDMMHFEAVVGHLEAELKATEERSRELRLVLNALHKRMFPEGRPVLPDAVNAAGPGRLPTEGFYRGPAG
jgi:hypothetical protein